MSSSVDVKIDDHSAEVLKALPEAAKKALKKIGIAAVGYAQDGTPVDTGLARNSITYAISGESAAISKYKADRPKIEGGKTEEGTYNGTAPKDEDNAVYIGSNVEYFQVLETGSSKGHNAWHMLRNAATQHSDEYKRLTEETLKNG